MNLKSLCPWNLEIGSGWCEEPRHNQNDVSVSHIVVTRDFRGQKASDHFVSCPSILKLPPALLHQLLGVKVQLTKHS